MRGILLLTCLAAVVPPSHDLVDISSDRDAPEKQKYLQARVNDVLLVEAASGQRAVIQFTAIGGAEASYRWRFRRTRTSEVLTGAGTLAERNERIPDGPGFWRTLPLPGNDTIIRAGDIRAQWSAYNDRTTWFYYHPARAKVTVLPPKQFEREP